LSDWLAALAMLFRFVEAPVFDSLIARLPVFEVESFDSFVFFTSYMFPFPADFFRLPKLCFITFVRYLKTSVLSFSFLTANVANQPRCFMLMLH
jgi:hypothetical protein